MPRRRGDAIGIDVHAHMCRHGFADAWLSSGGTEADLMRLAGWKSRQMLDRYVADARAREAHRRLGREIGRSSLEHDRRAQRYGCGG